MNTKIVEERLVNGRIEYTIYQRHFIFRWWWVPAWVNCGVSCQDTFNTLEDALNNICYFDGSKSTTKIVYVK